MSENEVLLGLNFLVLGEQCEGGEEKPLMSNMTRKWEPKQLENNLNINHLILLMLPLYIWTENWSKIDLVYKFENIFPQIGGKIKNKTRGGDCAWHAHNTSKSKV